MMANNMEVFPSDHLNQPGLSRERQPIGWNELAWRDEQWGRPLAYWRPLRSAEIDALHAGGNVCDDWTKVQVSDPFDPSRVRFCHFHGRVRIGKMNSVCLKYHDLQLPAGLSHSMIISCDIGDDVAIHRVRYLQRYQIDDNVILFNIDEMSTTEHAKFGHGVLCPGESEDLRVWLDLGNEAGGRAVLPFAGMTPGDAYLWAKYRDDTTLQQRLKAMTQQQFDQSCGRFGRIGQGTAIKECRIIKDTWVGQAAYIKGANKLKNLTVQSSPDESTQIGEGVELVNGIIHVGCRVFYGCKAVRFIMAPHSKLKYGARLIHSYLGDNSTVSCCEILNNLIFPAHEQHHNNSFLIAATVLGQSNIAAGATVGSNHNSRANDGEIIAGRGFWPGLCTSLKHSSKFASFTLLAKGDYPAELNIPLPFSLLSNDKAHDRLIVMPAYWWMYNMYALVRNSWKFHTRDKRLTPTQHVEFDFLAPDTVEEIFAALGYLERKVGEYYLAKPGFEFADHMAVTGDNQVDVGRWALLNYPAERNSLQLTERGFEASRRPAMLIKPAQAWDSYIDMLYYYAVKNLLTWRAANPEATLEDMNDALAAGQPRETHWVNIGGQLMLAADLDALREKIRSEQLADWSAIHAEYDRLWETYQLAKQKHALATLLNLREEQRLGLESWQDSLAWAGRVQDYIVEATYRTREKDYSNPFRQATFRNAAEQQAVVGTIDDNSFVQTVRQQAAEFSQKSEQFGAK